MPTTILYDSNTTQAIATTSASFSVPQAGTAAIRLVGAPKDKFSARLDFSDNNPVVYDGKICVLRSTHTCFVLTMPGTYQFVINNPDKDGLKIEVTT